MKPWLMAVIAGRSRVLKTAGPFTADAAFIVPVSTSNIENATGKGAAGTPSYSTSGYFYTQRAESQGRLRGTSTWVVLASSTSSSEFSTSSPSDGCGPAISSSNATYDAYRSCSYYSNIRAGTKTTPATTGAATVAFGKNFPGGTGTSAPITAHANTPVTPGASYPLTVPAGGSLTFTYYE